LLSRFWRATCPDEAWYSGERRPIGRMLLHRRRGLGDARASTIVARGLIQGSCTEGRRPRLPTVPEIPEGGGIEEPPSALVFEGSTQARQRQKLPAFVATQAPNIGAPAGRED
jgi:hypothetical protein